MARRGSRETLRFVVGPDGKLRPTVTWFADGDILTAADLNEAFGKILCEANFGPYRRTP